jgi:ParB-like chromosome segregation protein Spo0J
MTTESSGLEIQRLREVPPEDLDVDDVRPSGRRPADTRLVKNVREVGIVEPPLVRETDDGLAILDGTRRVDAAEQLGFDTVYVLVVEADDADALATWLTAHEHNRDVVDEDRERSLRRLVGASPRGHLSSEEREKLEQRKFDLGLRTTADRIEDAVSNIEGVGRTIAESLADEFESKEAALNASADELADVPGVGPKRAERLAEGFDLHRRGVTTVHV